MLAPQSEEEIRPIVERLQQIDPLLDIRWNPEAVIVKPGSYSVEGHRVDPIYDGRWEVIRYQTPSLRSKVERDFIVLCTVTEPHTEGGILYMVPLRDGGKYAPIGEWLVTLMHEADAQNVEQFRKLREKLWAQHDAAEAARDKLDEGAAIEAMEHQQFLQLYTARRGNWQGQGADFAAMERAAAARRILSH